MSKLKIPFGLRDGRLFAAGDVANGLSCGCLCPGCGAKLIAKHPKEKLAHFAHSAQEACSTGYETALHLAAKQALLQRRELYVPSISARQWLHDGGTGLRAEAIKVIAPKIITLDSVEAESRGYEGIIPDIVATHKGKLLFVEVAVTHFVDSVKREKLRRVGVPTLEIDLSRCPELPTLAEIEDLVVREGSNRVWVVNPREKLLQRHVHAEAQRQLEDLVIRKVKSKLLMWSEHERYMRLPDTEKLRIEVGGTGLSFADVSPYIGKRVRGGRSFGVRPEVWQAAFFRMYVCDEEPWSFEVDDVAQWLAKHLTLTPPFPNADKVAVWDYLVQLEQVGLLKRIGKQLFAVVEDAAASDAAGAVPF